MDHQARHWRQHNGIGRIVTCMCKNWLVVESMSMGLRRDHFITARYIANESEQARSAVASVLTRIRMDQSKFLDINRPMSKLLESIPSGLVNLEKPDASHTST